MKTLFINIVLLLVALFLAIFLFPIGWVHGLFTLRLSLSRLSNYVITIALSIDQTGNVILAPMFNAILIKKEGSYMFGDEDDTISYTLGRNKLRDTLKPLGTFLANILDAIDKNHCIKAVSLAWDKGRKYCLTNPLKNEKI